MKHFLIGATLAAVTATVVGPVQAQAPWPPAVPPQLAAGPLPGGYYPFSAPTPSDAYRQGLINRWELERYEGPTPQALQGPSPDGGGQSGGDDRGN
jgi:hypothetical protein